MISFVILDVDGTLIDSVEQHAQAWQKAFEKFGKKVELQDIRDQIGKGGDQLLPVFLSEQELADFGEELEEYRGEIFKKEYLPQVKPLPEARTLTARLVADGKRIALASSAKPEELEYFKELLGVEDFLDAETDADDAEKSKPHPDIFAVAMQRLGNPAPEKTIVIGDSPYDAMAASKIGVQTIGVLSGGFDEEWLRREGCTEIYKDPADLLKNYDDSLLCCKDSIKIPTLSDVVSSILVL